MIFWKPSFTISSDRTALAVQIEKQGATITGLVSQVKIQFNLDY